MKTILRATLCLTITYVNAQAMQHQAEFFTPKQAANLKEQSMHYKYHSTNQKQNKKKLMFSTAATFISGCLLHLSSNPTSIEQKKLRLFQAGTMLLCTTCMINSAFNLYDNKKNIKNIVGNCAKDYSEKQIAAVIASQAINQKSVLTANDSQDTLHDIKTTCDLGLCLPEFIRKVQDHQKINASKKLR